MTNQYAELTGMDWTTRTVDTHVNGTDVYQFFADYDAGKAYYRLLNGDNWRPMIFNKGDTVDTIANTAWNALQAAYDSIKK